MLLSIDQSKIKKILGELKPRYSVSPLSVASGEAHSEKMPLFSVSGTVPGEVFAPPNLRSDLLRLRHKIENSGVILKSPEESEIEINELRGRT